jgi:hypothetical protein
MQVPSISILSLCYSDATDSQPQERACAQLTVPHIAVQSLNKRRVYASEKEVSIKSRIVHENDDEMWTQTSSVSTKSTLTWCSHA